MSKHTINTLRADGILLYGDDGDRCVAMANVRLSPLDIETSIAIGADIAHRWNCHDELVGALQDVLNAFWDMSPLEFAQAKGLPYMSDEIGRAYLDQARAAIAKATQEGAE